VSRFILTESAERDLAEIRAYVAKDNPTAAHGLMLLLTRAMRRLADRPNLGHGRQGLIPDPLRLWPVRSYLIVYFPNTRPLQILRVLSGFRDVEELLKS
jgi:plasmid stabilization system protein ParE